MADPKLARPTLSENYRRTIEELMTGKRWAFTALPCEHGAALGIVTDQATGATPLPCAAYCVDGMDEAMSEAERLNALRGLLDWQSIALALGALDRREPWAELEP